VNIETPEFMESEEGEEITEPPFSPRIESAWRGLIIMKDVITFTVSAEEVTFNEIFLFTDRTKRESKFQRSFCFILCVGLSNIQCCGSGAFLTPGSGIRNLTIYAPMSYTAPCVIVLMRADTLCGEVGGGGLELEIESFGPLEIARADRRVPFGVKKLEISSCNPPPPTSPHNVSARIKTITHGAV
jgi:hypothetical protein